MPSESQRASDAEQLGRLGYAQQLLRDMGGFANFAVSFSVISILTGGITLYGYGLEHGGPRVMGLGWPLVTVMTLGVAASLAQLASSFPTAGALYHWSSLLGGRGWGFATAWLNTVGQFAITAAIDYGLAEFLLGALGLPADRRSALPLCGLLLFSHAALNHAGVRAVSLLNRFSAWYHLVGVAVLIGLLAVFAPHRAPAFLLAGPVARGAAGYGFLVGLLQAAWTFTGYDASAHVTEETVDPTRNAPWGIFLSVLVSGVAGYAMLIAVTLAIGDMPAALAAPNPFLFILASALGPTVARALLWMAMGAMWFCGLASVTSNSRMLFAFARDGGLPGSAHLAKVSARFQSPHVAVWVSAGAAGVIALWAQALSAMTALSTLALYASYAAPIWLGMRARAQGRWSVRGPWDLGRWSPWVNGLSVAWVAFLLVVFVLPPNQLAGYTFAGCMAAVATYWFAVMRTRFRGPPVALTAASSSPASAPARTPPG